MDKKDMSPKVWSRGRLSLPPRGKVKAGPTSFPGLSSAKETADGKRP